MYLRDAWYVACWSRDLEDKPYPVTIMGEDVVIFRTSDGIAALEDRCPHRHLPLSQGRICGDTIRCGYHGAEIDAVGRCVRVPSQKAVPPRARIRTYAAIERYGWIWLWTGDEAAADPRHIPDFSHLTNPEYAAVGSTNHVACSYQLLVDNLLDLSHLGFVHLSTIGNQAQAEKGKLKTEKTPRGVRVTRWVLDAPQAPTTAKLGIFPPDSNLDRSQIIDFVAPAFVIIHTGSSEAGTGVPEGLREHRQSFWVMNAATPRDEHSCYYFWAGVRNFAVGDEALSKFMFDQVSEAFDEDKHVLEAQQRSILKHGDSWEVTFQADAGVVEGRRQLERLIEEERCHYQEKASAAE
jgi:vanillate O-demethylase monooxygenase subunit